jgi:hypothetical protein
MSRRRFAVLVCALVAVNAFFWLAQGGLALPRALIDRFFGPRMIRAEVIVQGPGGVNDFRLDRGVIVSAFPGSLVLRSATAVWSRSRSLAERGSLAFRP